MHRSGQVFTRVVVPLVLFVIIVGGVAFVFQYLPHFRRPPQTSATPLQNMIKFDYVAAVWREPKVNNTEYVAEFEPGQLGHYDYPIENISGKEIEVGLDSAGCTCSDVKIALFSPGTSLDVASWTPLLKPAGKPAEREKTADALSVLIAEGQRGVIRLGWKTRSDLGMTSLNARLWFQPRGLGQSKQYQKLTAIIDIVSPVRFLKDFQFPSLRDSASAQCICWSPTRDLNVPGDDGSPGIAIDPRAVEPGFVFKVTPLTAEEAETFRQELGKMKFPSRVKSAVRLEVSVFEKRNDIYLDQGHFSCTVPFLLKGETHVSGPSLTGYIQSDVRIIGCEEGKIKLGSFSRKDGSKVKEYSIHMPHAMLTLVGKPNNVDVGLDRSESEGHKFYRLTVKVPANTIHFPPLQNAITLRSQPMEHYLAGIASAVGGAGSNLGTAQLGPLPDVAGFANVASSWGFSCRQTRIPVLGEVSR